ncbi:MAG: flagellar basal-body rod protein FlgF [Cellulosilyticaceae bacterium]
MIRGLYTAATGMNAQAKKMDVISNDLANVNTAGYKKDDVVISSFPEVLMSKMGGGNTTPDGPIGRMSLGVRVDEVYTQFSQGSLVKTDGLVDIAIQGDGFFVVETPAGMAYTRDGKFSITADGMLVTKEGYAVIGQNGQVEIGEDFLDQGGDLKISEQGEVVLNGEIVDQLDIANFADTRSLRKIDDNLLQSDGERVPFEGKLIQGFMEASNVNPVTAMVDMISVSRAYEASQKMIQVHDNLLGKAVNEIARV